MGMSEEELLRKQEELFAASKARYEQQSTSIGGAQMESVEEDS